MRPVPRALLAPACPAPPPLRSQAERPREESVSAGRRGMLAPEWSPGQGTQAWGRPR